jgi:hypothetical protein
MEAFEAPASAWPSVFVLFDSIGRLIKSSDVRQAPKKQTIIMLLHPRHQKHNRVM